MSYTYRYFHAGAHAAMNIHNASNKWFKWVLKKMLGYEIPTISPRKDYRSETCWVSLNQFIWADLAFCIGNPLDTSDGCRVY